MSFEDIAKITAAAASAPLTALIIKVISDRKAQREAARQEQMRGDSSLSVAALGSYKEIIASYKERVDALSAENHELHEEIRALHLLLHKRKHPTKES